MPGIILGSGNVAVMKTDKSLYLWNSLERKTVACFLKQESQYTSEQGKCPTLNMLCKDLKQDDIKESTPRALF